MTKQSEALLKLQMIDFAIIDVAMYLNAYPDNKKALDFLRQLREIRKPIVEEYEAKFGPLTIFGIDDPNFNTYINGPWPWESEV